MARRVLLRDHPAQPSSALAVNWGHPITRGLIGAFVPGVRFNLADGVGLVSVGTTSLGAGPTGLEVSAGGIGYPEPASAADPLAKLDVNVGTALAFCRQTVATNGGVALGRYNGSSSPSWAIGLHGGSFNGPYAVWGTFSFTPSTQILTTTRPSVSVVTGDGSTARVYANGAFVTSGSYTAASTQYSPGSARQVWLGPQNGLATNTNTRPALGLLWNRVLSAAEIAQISANPWQVFQPQRRSMAWVSGPTIYRPGSDISVAGWTATPGGTLASCIDEAAADDGDYITSPDLVTNAVLGLSASLPAGTYDVRVRGANIGGAGQLRVRFLDSSNTDVGGTGWQALTSTPTTYTLSATTTATADRFRIEVQA